MLHVSKIRIIGKKKKKKEYCDWRNFLTWHIGNIVGECDKNPCTGEKTQYNEVTN